MRTAILTISTSVSRREREDEGGPLLARLAEEAGADVDAMEVVPDDFGLIEDRLHHFADAGYALVLTTGGTGLTPDDVTPEATKAAVERDVPGSPRRCAPPRWRTPRWRSCRAASRACAAARSS